MLISTPAAAPSPQETPTVNPHRIAADAPETRQVVAIFSFMFNVLIKTEPIVATILNPAQVINAGILDMVIAYASLPVESDRRLYHPAKIPIFDPSTAALTGKPCVNS